MIEITLRHDGHVTKNCYRFEEIDTDTNKPKDKSECAIPYKIYFSKHIFHHQPAPDEITVKVEW